MNPLPPNLHLGTIGELLVQIRLLEFDVQAAPPLKDTGNDLIAIRSRIVWAIQVKATEGDRYVLPEEETEYHALAAVRIVRDGQQVVLDESEVFIIPKPMLPGLSRRFSEIERWKLNTDLIDTMFPKGHANGQGANGVGG